MELDERGRGRGRGRGKEKERERGEGGERQIAACSCLLHRFHRSQMEFVDEEEKLEMSK